MLRIAILDPDETNIQQFMQYLITAGPVHEVIGTWTSSGEAMEKLKRTASAIDLLFMDYICARDVTLELKQPFNAPVIMFGDNTHALYGYETLNVIGYLERPIKEAMIGRILQKFYSLRAHFTQCGPPGIPAPNAECNYYKERIVVKKGPEYQSLKTENVAYFFTDQKLVFLVDKDGRKYLTDVDNLTDLAVQLNPRLFFRANRKFIININYVRKYRSCNRVKLEVEMALQSAETVMISQENSACFRQWIQNL